ERSRWDVGIALGHPALYLHRAPNRVYHAGELGKKAVAGVLYDPASMLRDFRFDQLPEVTPEPLVRSLLVLSHKARVPRHVCGEDGGEAADRWHLSRSGGIWLYQSTPKPAAALAAQVSPRRRPKWLDRIRRACTSPRTNKEWD